MRTALHSNTLRHFRTSDQVIIEFAGGVSPLRKRHMKFASRHFEWRMSGELADWGGLE